jgi:hypothetical protein
MVDQSFREYELALISVPALASSGELAFALTTLSVQFSMMADDSYPTVCPTDKDDVDGVWVTYTWQRRGVALRKVFEG